jgi:ribosomal protein S27AE
MSRIEGAPERIQLSRAKGWRKPEGAVVVARPSRWGNPFRVEPTREGRARAVRLFELHAVGVTPFTAATLRHELGGYDLACWCPLDQPCHADVLLALANAPAPVCPRCGTGRMMNTEDMGSEDRWLECSVCGSHEAWV